MSKTTARVVFTPSGLRGEFAIGTPLLQAARTLGVDVDSVCGGRGLCGRCQVLCTEGEFAKHAMVSSLDHLSPFSETEARYAQRKTLAPGRRLSCQTLIQGDLVIDVPAESQIHRQVVRKDAEHRDIRLNVATHLHYVEVAEPDMDEPKSDFQRLLEALSKEWQLTDLALREGDWAVTVAVYQTTQIIAVWPGYKEKITGIAVDVGSTTIAAHLCDLGSGDVIQSGGIMNPQIRFGEDLMSRVSYLMMHPEGLNDMTRAVRQGLSELIIKIADEAGLTADDVLEVTIVGNPIMHHLLLGISPIELGGAPFALAVDQSMTVTATALELDLHPGARVYLLPCIAGHVGADTAGMILSEEPQLADPMTLLIDVGTNAEIVLGNRQGLMACSSPTGPAFEGAQISCGQRAAPGAIERVRIDPQTLEARFKIIGSDLWSDDPEFAADTQGLKISGICGSGIIEAVACMYLAGVLTEDGVINGDLAPRTERLVKEGRTWSYVIFDHDIVISVSQNDVRQIQLAKGALYAGAKLLMDKMGVTSVDRIRLAGAFGSHIDVKYAMVLGLIPDCPLDQVASAGNAAGTGARIALLNVDARTEIEALVRQVVKIETAVEKRFQEYFVDAMSIPHKTDPFENLFKVVDRPPKVEPSGMAGGRKRRRRRAR